MLYARDPQRRYDLRVRTRRFCATERSFRHTVSRVYNYRFSLRARLPPFLSIARGATVTSFGRKFIPLIERYTRRGRGV